MAEKRSGSSVPNIPAPSVLSAVLISGGATRHGMAAVGCGIGSMCVEFMDDFISSAAPTHGIGAARRCPLGLHDDDTSLIPHIRVLGRLAETRLGRVQPAAPKGMSTAAPRRCSGPPLVRE